MTLGVDLVVILVFLAASSFVVFLSLVVAGRRGQMEERLNDLANKSDSPAASREMVQQFPRSTLPKFGTMFLPKEEEKRTQLTVRLVNAGYYGRQALVVYLGIKGLLVFGCPLVILFLLALQLLPLTNGLMYAAISGGLGLLGPSFWLDYRKKKRQTSLRRALPDALDVLVICLEGGLSFSAAVARVVAELRLAPPILAVEMRILQREVQLGCSMGEAWRLFGTRCDLEEIRSLAGVVLQSEKYGASLVKALRVHADSLRIKRMQRAE